MAGAGPGGLGRLLSRPRLGEVEGGRDNNLNLIRLVLASLVILSHCYVIKDRFVDEPMQRALGFNDLGGTAVLSFFFLSGYLIFKSAQRSTPDRFVSARVLRILPALATVTILCAFVLGPIATTLPPADYLADPGTYFYLGNAVLHLEHATLPGVFADRADRIVNQPLWTLPAEWTMYAAMLCACVVATVRRDGRLSAAQWIVVALVLLFTITLPALPWRHAYQWMAFAGLGAAVYLGRRHIPLSVPLGIALVVLDVAALLTVPIAGKMLFPFALAYLLLVAGYHPALHVAAYHRLGDYSYGLYVYGWPIQQLLLHRAGTPMGLFAAVYPIALIAAVLSWHLIEGPCLRIKARLPRRAHAIGTSRLHDPA